jgi:acyl-CoA oxidase
MPSPFGSMFSLMQQLPYYYVSLCRCLFSSASNFMKKMFVNKIPEMSKAIHIYSSALKATLTWQNMTTLQVQLLWHHGSLSNHHNYKITFSLFRALFVTGFSFKCIRNAVRPVVDKVWKQRTVSGIFKAEFDVQSTFEGDNNVLIQQVIIVSNRLCISLNFLHPTVTV